MSQQVAGLDIGWGNKLDLEWDPQTKRRVLRRELPPGRYPYKFVYGDRWTYSADHPTVKVELLLRMLYKPFMEEILLAFQASRQLSTTWAAENRRMFLCIKNSSKSNPAEGDCKMM